MKAKASNKGRKMPKITSSKQANNHATIKKQSAGSASIGNKPLALFLIKFFAIFGAANLLIEFVDLSSLNYFIAAITAGAMGLVYGGNIIIAGSQSFAITNFCTGLVSASILGAIIFALRKPKFSQKAALFFAGAAGILLINIPRIMLVLFAARQGFDAELVHEFTWFLMSALVLAIWFFGTKRVAGVQDFSGLV